MAEEKKPPKTLESKLKKQMGRQGAITPSVRGAPWDCNVKMFRSQTQPRIELQEENAVPEIRKIYILRRTYK